ncbi:MAG TPA: hypothetical protein PK794_05795, partial [Armatimonadota bacterium]|nr:hypothetical protein [Armatimonadota bacterium]
VAARAVGNGRMAACGIVPEFTHRGGYSSGNTRYELRLGNQGGTMLEKGDGMIPSDAAELLLRLYAWLAGDSATAGFGGYVPGTPAVAGAPAPDPNAGLPWRSYRALIGARSKYGGGTGTVAEYAQAAKDAGFSLLVFTERFAALDPAQWDAYLADCAASSDETLTVLPGFEIDDVEGSHFLYLAPPFYPHRSWLTADGRRLLSPYTLNFYYAKHMVVVHRPESSPIPTERLKHFQGISVYTYRDGALVDNSLAAFQWQVQSASFPVPIVVHELNSPAEVAAAARTGFQQWLPEAPTPADAVNRFCRQGYNHPTHPMISEGPRIAPLEVLDLPDPNRRMEAKEAQTFELAVRVEHTIPLHTITLYDGFTPVRRWRTTEKNFAATAVFPFSHQYGFSVIAEDAAGKRALRSMFWIAPGRWPGHFRCTDRQNWLGHLAMYYTGAFLPFGGAYHALKMPIKGTEEGNGLFTALPGTCMAAKLQTPFTGNDVVLTEFLLDEKYVDATFKTVGLAATPSRASRRSSVYAGRVRHYSFTQSHEAEPWVALIEYDLTLKRAVEPINPAGLFPAIDQVRAAKYCWWDGTRFITGAMNPAARDQVLPIPRGGLGGGVIPLDDGFALSDGRIGRLLPGAPDYLPAGTRLAGRFLVAGRSNQVGAYDTVTRNFDAAPERWLRAMGFAGATPYALRFTRGTAGPVAFCVPVTPEAYGVAGAVRTSADIPYDLPLQITGLNPRWVAGSWREGERIRYTGVFENTAWPRLNVGKPGAFYAGNLLTADHPHLVLAIRAWTADAISIEVHNPTGAAIEATVATPPEMRGYTALRAKVAVPAGATVWLEAP